ncbi:MAG: hypothetical protein MUP58_01060 [Candidatus Nanohaloarchaeota archaeon QJJ-9]|nr:hypothetical protein [Candidatus Nanohaloarchaeota archaeon QJJ-9]
MRKLVCLLFIVLILSSFATSLDEERGERLINSSEPEFLRDIGPRDPRVDNPLAAVVVTSAVSLVFVYAFSKARD